MILTFQENDPPLAVVVSADVVAGHAAVVTSDVTVIEELALQTILNFVTTQVKCLCQLPERVRWQALRIRSFY